MSFLTKKPCTCVVPALAFVLLLSSTSYPQSPSQRGRSLGSLKDSIAQAQLDGDARKVIRFADQAKRAMGAKVGIPEVPEEYRPVPKGVKPLSSAEVKDAFQPFLGHISKSKWWRVGQDPSKLDRPLRDAASVVAGCAYAVQAGCRDREKLLALATDSANYLLWAQQQTERGLFPFPARRGGRSKAFVAAEGVLARAERRGLLDEVVHNGWFVDDMGDGGLQFDNGVCGVAILDLFRLTGDKQYLSAAQAAAEWAIEQPVVPNWNFNSFSVHLLAELARETGDKRYLVAARRKAELGVYPGQLLSGPKRGRWFDPHNARLTYHYIMVRALVSLAAVLEEGSADREKAIEAVSLALAAHKADFSANSKGLGNVESCLDAVLNLEELFPESSKLIPDGGQLQAIAAIESYCVARHRAGAPPASPGVWGRFLRYRASHPGEANASGANQ